MMARPNIVATATLTVSPLATVTMRTGILGVPLISRSSIPRQTSKFWLTRKFALRPTRFVQISLLSLESCYYISNHPWQVTLPSKYYFGLSAATAEKPDSFEVFKFLVTGTDSSGQSNTESRQQQQQQQQKQQQQKQQDVKRETEPPADNNPESSEKLRGRVSAFEDRLQKIDTTVNSISAELNSLSQKNTQRHQEAIRESVTKAQFHDLDSKLQRIESTLSDIRKDLEGRDYSKQFSKLQKQLQTSHSNLADNLQSTLMSSTYPSLYIQTAKAIQIPNPFLNFF